MSCHFLSINKVSWEIWVSLAPIWGRALDLGTCLPSRTRRSHEAMICLARNKKIDYISKLWNCPKQVVFFSSFFIFVQQRVYNYDTNGCFLEFSRSCWCRNDTTIWGGLVHDINVNVTYASKMQLKLMGQISWRLSIGCFVAIEIILDWDWCCTSLAPPSQKPTSQKIAKFSSLSQVISSDQGEPFETSTAERTLPNSNTIFWTIKTGRVRSRRGERVESRTWPIKFRIPNFMDWI